MSPPTYVFVIYFELNLLTIDRREYSIYDVDFFDIKTGFKT